MMIIPLIILINFYIGILNGFDQSLEFLYFVMVIVVSMGVYGILFLFLRDKWKGQWAYMAFIGIILVSSTGFGFLSFEELNKVEVNIVKLNMGSSVTAQFEVSGLFKNVPETKSIWLYTVHPTTKKYYPEPAPVIKLNNSHSGAGSWSYYGTVSTKRVNIGKSFQIGIFTSNKADRSYIEQKIRSVNGSTEGMNQLPDRTEDLGIKINVNNI